MGGRLALYAAVRFPHAAGGLIVIGADPGIEEDSARAERLNRDEALARQLAAAGDDNAFARWLQRWYAAPLFGRLPRRADFDTLLRSACVGARPPWRRHCAVSAWPCSRCSGRSCPGCGFRRCSSREPRCQVPRRRRPHCRARRALAVRRMPACRACRAHRAAAGGRPPGPLVRAVRRCGRREPAAGLIRSCALRRATRDVSVHAACHRSIPYRAGFYFSLRYFPHLSLLTILQIMFLNVYSILMVCCWPRLRTQSWRSRRHLYPPQRCTRPQRGPGRVGPAPGARRV